MSIQSFNFILVHSGGYLQLGVSHRLECSEEEQQRCLAMGAKLGRALNDKGEAEGAPASAARQSIFDD